MERQVAQLSPHVCLSPLGFYARLVLAQSFRGEFLKLRFKVQVQQSKLATLATFSMLAAGQVYLARSAVLI